MLSSSPASAGLLAAWLAPFAGLFTGPAWGRVPVLVEGALLTFTGARSAPPCARRGARGRPTSHATTAC